MRSVFVLDALRTISEESVEMRMRLLFTYCELSRHLVEVERHLGAYCKKDLGKLSCMDIGSLSRSPSGSWNMRECEIEVSQWALHAA